MKRQRWIGVFMVSILLAFSLVTSTAEAAKKPGYSEPMVKLKEEMRRLWTEHAFWTRNYIVSAVAGLEDQEKMLARLLRNQDEIGAAIKPFYGEAAGNQLAALLREHILVAGKIVEAAKAGNQADVQKYNQIWHKNADEIARFLSKANPYLSEQQIRDILYRHLALVGMDLDARLKKDWDADIRAFDEGEAHLILLADTLSTAIIKQFPKKFK